MVDVALMPDEIEALRAKVSSAHHWNVGRRGWRGGRRFKRPVWIRFSGGPLHGIRCVVEAADASGAYLAWCLVRHDGPVQAVYGRTADPAVWEFRAVEEGVR